MKHNVDLTEWIIQRLKPDHVTTQCRVDVMTSALLMISAPDYVAPRLVKQRLLNINAKLKAAQAAIDELAPDGVKEMLHASPGISETARRAAELADSIVVPKRSGGSSKVRTLAMQKRFAAERAHVLMKKYRSGKLTSMKNGDFYRIAAALFKLGTGRESDMSRACAKVLSAK
jgi:hypothetical protein